jgi:hypothetical protein
MSTIPMTDRQREEQKIMRILNRLIASGQPFTVDQIWDRATGLSPARHRGWLGRQIQILAGKNRIETVDWRLTGRSSPHSRPARVWQSVTADQAAA